MRIQYHVSCHQGIFGVILETNNAVTLQNLTVTNMGSNSSMLDCALVDDQYNMNSMQTCNSVT